MQTFLDSSDPVLGDLTRPRVPAVGGMLSFLVRGTREGHSPCRIASESICQCHQPWWRREFDRASRIE
jgi:hypothetical protein